MMEYRAMIDEARNRGLVSEDKMYESIASVEQLLECLDEDSRCRFYRKQHEILYGEHYDETFADMELSEVVYVDRDGKRQVGPRWSCQEVESATKSMSFDNAVTKHDKWVAMNVMYADLCRVLSDDVILQTGYSFFFADEDWPDKDVKIWQYMSAKKWYEQRGV